MPHIILGKLRKGSLVENSGTLVNIMWQDQVPKSTTALSMIRECLNTVTAIVRKLPFSRNHHYFGVGNFSKQYSSLNYIKTNITSGLYYTCKHTETQKNLPSL